MLIACQKHYLVDLITKIQFLRCSQCATRRQLTIANSYVWVDWSKMVTKIKPYSEDKQVIEISHRQLQPNLLDNILNSIVLREISDYGQADISTEEKKKQLTHWLDSGQVIIVYDARESFFDIETR